MRFLATTIQKSPAHLHRALNEAVAAPVILGNIVHHNPGGGILTGKGVPQGKYPIDKPTAPLITQNIVYSNAEEKPGIGNDAAGSKEFPVRIIENIVTKERAVGIG